jgi:hypothetical protein
MTLSKYHDENTQILQDLPINNLGKQSLKILEKNLKEVSILDPTLKYSFAEIKTPAQENEGDEPITWPSQLVHALNKSKIKNISLESEINTVYTQFKTLNPIHIDSLGSTYGITFHAFEGIDYKPISTPEDQKELLYLLEFIQQCTLIENKEVQSKIMPCIQDKLEKKILSYENWSLMDASENALKIYTEKQNLKQSQETDDKRDHINDEMNSNLIHQLNLTFWNQGFTGTLSYVKILNNIR